jgi:hypothetical protein
MKKSRCTVSGMQSVATVARLGEGKETAPGSSILHRQIA